MDGPSSLFWDGQAAAAPLLAAHATQAHTSEANPVVNVPNALVVALLRARRANRSFVSVAGAERRLREQTLRPAPYGPPRSLRADVHVEAEQRHGWPVFTLRPHASVPVGGVVYVHGGAWVNQIAAQHWALAARIAAEANVAVTVPIYPLVPYGTAANTADTFAALVRESQERWGPTSLAGDSAGGQIALSTALRLRDEGVLLPRVALLSPALDLTISNPEIERVQPTDPWLATRGVRLFCDLWRGDLDGHDPLASPLFGDLGGLGPLTLLTGTRDILNPDARLLRDRARASGVALDFHEEAGAVHVYALIPTAAGRRGAAQLVNSLRPPVVGALPRNV